MENLYSLYLKTYGKVKSGKVLEEGDYIKLTPEGGKERTSQENLAITLAVDHAQNRGYVASKADFEKEIHSLSGSE